MEFSFDTPGEIVSVQELRTYLVRQLSNLENALRVNRGTSCVLDPIDVAPTKVLEGMLVYALGATWNPGAGAGIYAWRGGAWRFLG